LAAAPLSVWADPWRHAISVPVSIEYNSNARLSDPAVDLWRYRFVPNYSLTGTFGPDTLSANLSVRVERSTEPLISIDRQDPILSVVWGHLTPTGAFGVSANYRQISTLVNQLDETGNPSAADGTQTLKSVTANWSGGLSERSTLSAYGVYSDRTFDRGSSSGSSGSTLQSGGLNFNHTLNERIGLFIGPAVNRFEPKSANGQSSTRYTFSAGGNWNVTERLSASAQAGVIKTEGNGALSQTQSYWLSYAAGRSQFSVNGSHGSFSTGGQGGFSNRDTVTGSWSYSIDEKTQSGINLAWSQFDSSGAKTAVQKAGTWLSHDLGQFWSVRLNYQYTQRERANGAQNNGNAATNDDLVVIPSHQVNLTLTYSLPDL
jgi:hypothetical protein